MPDPPDFHGERQSRSARKRPLRICTARGLMCRELHDPCIGLFERSIKTKSTTQTIYFIQRLPTAFSTAFQEVAESALKQAYRRVLDGWRPARLRRDGVLAVQTIAIEIMFDCRI